jgi:transcriptional regulator with XRE-family HTH domain
MVKAPQQREEGDPMPLGDKIRHLRRERGWTQAQLSERAGVKVNQISKLEQDDADPHLSTVYKLMKALECSPNQLLAEQQPIPAEKVDLHVVLDRLTDLPAEQTYPLIEVLERFCLGCEVANAARPERRYRDVNTRTMTIEELKSEQEC